MAKQADSGSAVAVKGLEAADKQIAMLKDRLLPYDPHIVTVPTIYPYSGGYDYENKGTPFEEYEVKQLQYVTLVGETDRGTAKPWPAAEWVDTIEARSPASMAARSNTTTPNAAANAVKESKIPKTKISIADYKNMKKTGVKSSPNPTGAGKPAHSRNISAVSGGEPLSWDNSFEGVADVRQNGLATSSSAEKGAVKPVEKSAVHASGISNAKAHPPASTNGHNHISDHARSKEFTSHPPTSRPPPEHIKHGLPPRPPSPPRSTPTYNLPDSKQQKRPLESADTSQPEKRSKIEHSRTPSNSQNNHSRTPSGSQNHLPRKPNTPLDSKPSPLKSQTQVHSSPHAKKTPVTKPASKDTPKHSEKPLDLPPILSPLPADLGSSPASGFATKKTEGKKSAQGTPSKHGLGSDTIVVRRAPSPLKEIPQPSRAASETFELPPLLSPTLPDVVEQELLRLQQKSAALNNEARLSSVEARHEKARRPDTPGVARKTTVPKVGHPPKKSHAESSKGPAEKSSLIVKLKYKKRRAEGIRRILGIRAKPSQDFVRLEKQRIAGQQKESRPLQDEDSDDADEPMAKTAAKAPASASKKRPEPVEPRSEPPAKRLKGPESIDVAKSKTALEPAFKSPALSQPNQKGLLSTPKKGDAMKSATMRKVNSSDGHAHTPQTSTSTPTSAEKPRVNGASHLDSRDLCIYLKRKMDSILHLKDGKRDTVDEAAKKLGLSVALECVAVYMVTFAVSDRGNKRRSSKDWESVIQLWEFINGLAKNTVLQRLSFELGALCREELGRAYNERLTEKFDPEIAKVLLANSTKKDRNWYLAHHPPAAASGIPDPGPALKLDAPLGPWTSMYEARDYVFEILEQFARKERTGWKPTEAIPGPAGQAQGPSPEQVEMMGKARALFTA
ncbi:uncharacterized protein LY89DRAFT_318143 [Mollisia scopiformis]|uniref:Uncharacterized protein n=1 Tax=Mollisia scopiformis TaxID=149040 RepID=A0A132B9E2_MOLSC|nr:uncharacterized protein LY89DRAFT_318143 [Mollisia scopiformis]KUJ09015.1 hypothetical protein LY89DRAFT_318143 [Mollisia scopiformis]